MSRGISRQQRQILGLGLALSRERPGWLQYATRTEVSPDALPRERWHARFGDVDITVAIAAVVLGGVPLVPTRAGLTGLDDSPDAMVLRTGIVRAFASLVRRELLTRCREPIGRMFDGKLQGGNYRGEYGLTEAGRRAGRPYEVTITDDIRRIVALLDPKWRDESWDRTLWRWGRDRPMLPGGRPKQLTLAGPGPGARAIGAAPAMVEPA